MDVFCSCRTSTHKCSDKISIDVFMYLADTMHRRNLKNRMKSACIYS
jgi:hypothetical protein